VSIEYFEKAVVFSPRARISLGEKLAGRTDGVSFQPAGVTTTVRNYILENVVLDADTLVLLQDGGIIPETAYFVAQSKLTDLEVQATALVRVPPDEDIIIGYNNAYLGYQHWLTQCLPAIDWSLRQQRSRPHRLLLPKLEPWQEDLICLLGHGASPRLIPQPGAQYVLSRAEFAEFLNGSTSFGICRSALETARRILEALPSSPSVHKALYVPCLNPYYGVIRSEATIIELLQRYGVHVVDRERLSTAARINLFRHADVVIGPLGEALTDVLFCRPRTLLWEWMPEHHQNASFNRLAQAAEVDYWGDLFESRPESAASTEWDIDAAIVNSRLSELSNRGVLPRADLGSPQAPASPVTMLEIWGPQTPRMPIHDLMIAFESLGDNCEFGLVQRHGGAEPLGLLRFAGIFLPIEVRLERLVAALNRRFEGLGADETMTVYLEGEPGVREFLVRESSYNLMYHTFVLEGEADVQSVRQRESTRLNFLRRKLLEDLETGAKIWVWKSAATIEFDQILPLLESLRAMGPNTLLWVVEADATHPPGAIERLEPDLIKGYVERFAPYDKATDIRPASWFEVCQNTYEVCYPASLAVSVCPGTI
jgi:capsular polysaccharide biosynthesis protein